MAHHPIFSSFASVASVASGEHLYDFMGAATRLSFKRAWAQYGGNAGRVVHPAAPPVDEHYFDWIGLLTAVARADGVFRMAELGAGWAPWLVRAALASRQRPQITGLELLAIEADPAHHAWIIQHFLDNDIDPVEHSIIHGAVSSHPGMLSFPAVVDPDIDYGASLRGTALAADTIDVRGWSIPEVLARFSGPLDFLHVDIQGAEYDSLPAAMDELKASVKSIMIGTHHPDSSHDALLATFRERGWREILVFPRNTLNQTPWGEIKTNDGFLLFENPDFIASAG